MTCGDGRENSEVGTRNSKFQNTLEANPTMGKFINPQIESRSKQRVKLLKEVEISKKKEDFSLTENKDQKRPQKSRKACFSLKRKKQLY